MIIKGKQLAEHLNIRFLAWAAEKKVNPEDYVVHIMEQAWDEVGWLQPLPDGKSAIGHSSDTLVDSVVGDFDDADIELLPNGVFQVLNDDDNPVFTVIIRYCKEDTLPLLPDIRVV